LSEPAERWGSFGELRGALEPILERKTEKESRFHKSVRVGSVLASQGRIARNPCRHKEAVSCYDKALKFDPRNAGFWICKGSALAALGQYETAISCMDKALTIDPRNVYAWINKAKSF